MSSDLATADSEPHRSKQQRFFNQANSLAIPAATSSDVVEVVKTSGYILYFPIPQATNDWQNNDISWLCDRLPDRNKSSKNTKGKKPESEAQEYAKMIGTYALEMSTLICSIAEISGTPSSLNGRTRVTGDIVGKENFPTVAEIYKMEYGSEATVPEGYRFNPGPTSATGATGPVATVDENGYVDTSNSPGVSAANSAALKYNWIPGMTGKGKIELPVHYTWEFDPCIAEAIANVENNLPAFKESSGQTTTNDEEAEEEEEAEEAEEDGGNPRRRRGGNRSNTTKAKNIKRYAKILFPWYLKSRLETNDKFVYANLDRSRFNTFTHAGVVYEQDQTYESFIEEQRRRPAQRGGDDNISLADLAMSSDIFESSSTTGVPPGYNRYGRSATLKYGYLGLPLLPSIKLPKVIPYVIYIPTDNDSYHMVIALRFIDPHFDANALSKRMQQNLLDKSNSGKDKGGRPFYDREVGMIHVPHLNDGFHNENRLFKRAGNPSLADSPQYYFQFLCDYFAISAMKDTVVSRKRMARCKQEAMTMAGDPNIDNYCSKSHPLNLNSLFTWERAVTFLQNVSDPTHDKVIFQDLEKMVTKMPILDLENPDSLSPARLNYTYEINLKPMLSRSRRDATTTNQEYRYRCYRYTAQQFRWCYYDKTRGAKSTAGLAVEMKPHVHPVFQLDDRTYTEIINRPHNHGCNQPETRTGVSGLIERSRYNVSLLDNRVDNMETDAEDSIFGSLEPTTEDPIVGEEDEDPIIRKEDEDSPKTSNERGISRLSRLMAAQEDSGDDETDNNIEQSVINNPRPLHRNTRNQITEEDQQVLYEAPRWTHLLDEEDGDICLQSDIKAIPNSKLPAGYDSYLIFLVLIENRIMGPLVKLRPTVTLGMSTINYLIDSLTFKKPYRGPGGAAGEKYYQKKIENFVTEYNHYFNHLERHRERVVKFTINYFFNPQIVKRVGVLMNEGWLSVIQHYGELRKQSVIHEGNRSINMDKLRPAYFPTMVDGYTMRTSIDSVFGAWCEQQARRMYEQTGLYQNNSLFFVAMLGCVASIFRMDGRDKFNLLFVGTFAAGKSYLIQLITSYCIKGFIYALQGASDQAFVGTGFLADRLISAAEGFSLMETNPQLMKGAITDSSVNKTVCSHDPKTGIRIKNDYYGGFYYGIMVAANEPSNDNALNSRFYRPIATRDSKIINYQETSTNVIVRERQRDKNFATTARETYRMMFDLDVYMKNLSLNETLTREEIHTTAINNPVGDTEGHLRHGNHYDNRTRDDQTGEVIIEPTPQVPPVNARIRLRRASSTSIRKPINHDEVMIEDACEEEFAIPGNPINKNVERKGNTLIHKTSTMEVAKHQGRIEMEEYWQHSQLMIFWLHKFQATGSLPQTNIEFWDNLEASVKEKIEEKFPFIFHNNPRILGRIKTMVMGVTEKDAIRRVFFDPTGPYYNNPIEPMHARALAPFLSVTYDHVCLALSIANDEIVDNVKGKIILAFLKQCGFYDYCQKFNAWIGKPTIQLEDHQLGSEEEPQMHVPTSNQNMAMQSNFLRNTINFGHKEGIKIDRKFCEMTGFHKVGWLHAEKDESLMAEVLATSIRSPPTSHTTFNVPTSPSADATAPEMHRRATTNNFSSGGFGRESGVDANSEAPPSRPTPQLYDIPAHAHTHASSASFKPPLTSEERPLGSISNKECIDLNKLVIQISTNRVEKSGGLNAFGVPKGYMDVLKKELHQGRCTDIGDSVLNAEVAKMVHAPLRRKEKRFKPIPYKEYLKAINDDDQMIIVPAETNPEDDTVAMKTGSAGNLLAFEADTTAGGKGMLNIILDVQALTYLDGYLIMMNIMQELSEELPLKRARIPLLFHGVGAQLSSIRIGSKKYGDLRSQTNSGEDNNPGNQSTNKITNVKFQSKRLDSYRSIVDYGGSWKNLPDNDSTSRPLTDDELYDDENSEVELTPSIDLSDYYRIKHILYNSIMLFQYDRDTGRFLFNLVDYTKPVGSKVRSKWVDMTYFFESTRKEKLFAYHKPMNDKIAKAEGSRKRKSPDQGSTTRDPKRARLPNRTGTSQ